MHLLTCKIKDTWRKKEVAAVLFLDIEGAFPNAIPKCLEYSMRKRRVPTKLASFIYKMLQNRTMVLHFDDYTSKPIAVNNGIGQGDPFSMALYQFYNADIIDTPKSPDKAAKAFVDDALLIATAKTFTKAHGKLYNMMTRSRGIIEWSTTHNSPLEYSKLALIDFAHQKCTHERAPLELPNITITPTQSTKYLGVYFDQHLSWKTQHTHAIEKGTKWAAQIKRALRATWGLTLKHARQLYISIALPRILYGTDIWYPPPTQSRDSPPQ
jgi:Reverse transcriptase (RNA-dependent DNA polymerase)